MQKVTNRATPQGASSIRRRLGQTTWRRTDALQRAKTLGQNAREAVNSSSILTFFGR